MRLLAILYALLHLLLPGCTVEQRRALEPETVYVEGSVAPLFANGQPGAGVKVGGTWRIKAPPAPAVEPSPDLAR